MHPIYLNHFFDVDYWTCELLRAFFTIKQEWSFKELQDQFLTVCMELNAPRGSAGSVVKIVHHFRYAKQISCVSAPGGVLIKVETVSSKGVRKSLVRAIPWALKRDAIKKRARDQRKSLLDNAEKGPAFTAESWANINRRLQANKRAEARLLAECDWQFRLRPNAK